MWEAGCGYHLVTTHPSTLGWCLLGVKHDWNDYSMIVVLKKGRLVDKIGKMLIICVWCTFKKKFLTCYNDRHYLFFTVWYQFKWPQFGLARTSAITLMFTSCFKYNVVWWCLKIGLCWNLQLFSVESEPVLTPREKSPPLENFST